MRLVVQRVEKAKVTEEKTGEVVGEIGKGLLVLVGVKKGDGLGEASILAEKIAKLRVMSDESRKMNLNLSDSGGSVLAVSQFTLHADTKGGNRPSFINAEEGEKAREIYLHFVQKLKDLGLKVETGSFGEYMKIEAILDGPVTIIYSDS